MNISNSDDTLPPGWIKGFSNSQKMTYYCHPETKHTQWHFPTVTEAANPHKAKARVQSNLKKRHFDQQSTAATSSSSSTPTNREQNQKRARQSPNSGNHTDNNSKKNYHDNDTPTLGNIINPDDIKKSLLLSNRTHHSEEKHRRKTPGKTFQSMSDDASSVAIIVPYRDIHPTQQRRKHLEQFIPFMIKFLSKQLQKGTISDFHIYIIEQSDDNRKFNRGKLLNIGFDIARKNRCRKKGKNNFNGTSTVNDGGDTTLDDEMVNHDVFIFHDVDLLPANEHILGRYYTQFPTVPIHIARVWDRYSNNPKYFGGIVSFSRSDMKRINGYPNTFWGWGGEDDEMQKRCERLNIKWKYPNLTSGQQETATSPLIIDLEDMNIDQKIAVLRSNKAWKCNVKWEALEEHEKSWRTNGLADLNYKILSTKDIDDDGNAGKNASRATKITVDVKLNGDHWTNDKSRIDDESFL